MTPSELKEWLEKDDYLSIDFEGRSALSLPKVGAYRYCEHPSTSAYCMAYRFGHEEPRIWILGQDLPTRIAKHVERRKPIHAWNAMFERLMWRNFCVEFLGWPEADLEQFVCTMARAQACGLPAGLDQAAIALRLQERKDTDGGKAMKKLAKPRKILPDGTIIWWEDKLLFKKTYEYCKQDVVTECAAGNKLPHLSPREQKLYWLDQEMNDEGFKLDQDLCVKADAIIEQAKRIYKERCVRICGIAPTQTQKLKKWIQDNGAPDLPTLERDVIKKYLKTHELPKKTKRVIELRFQSAKATSASKYKKALQAVCDDGKLHGMIRFLGAAATGRWSSSIVQLQNMTSAKLPDMMPNMVKSMTDIIKMIRDYEADFIGLETLLGLPMQAVTDAVRGMLVVEDDEELFSGDLKNIESRVIAIQAGQESILRAWRRFDTGKGPDLYVLEASKLFTIKHEQVTKEQRFWGKQEVLGLGFGGGPGALIRMVDKAGADISDLYPILWKKASDDDRSKALASHKKRGRMYTEKKWCAAWIVVNTWRKSNPDIVKYWERLENAAVAAVLHKGRTTVVGSIRYKADDDWLWCTLPSGRKIAYAWPHVKVERTPWGEDRPTLYAYYVNDKRMWVKFQPYGGHLSENTTQGDARDIIGYRLPVLKKHGYMPIMTVHDEAVSKRLKGTGNLKEYLNLLAVPPKWWPDLPIAADGWQGQHYRK